MLYRLYFMDPRTGHIIRFEEHQAPNDEAALALAREQEGANPLRSGPATARWEGSSRPIPRPGWLNGGAAHGTPKLSLPRRKLQDRRLRSRRRGGPKALGVCTLWKEPNWTNGIIASLATRWWRDARRGCPRDHPRLQTALYMIGRYCLRCRIDQARLSWPK